MFRLWWPYVFEWGFLIFSYLRASLVSVLFYSNFCCERLEYVERVCLTRVKSVREPAEKTRAIVGGTPSELGGRLLHGMLWPSLVPSLLTTSLRAWGRRRLNFSSQACVSWCFLSGFMRLCFSHAWSLLKRVLTLQDPDSCQEGLFHSPSKEKVLCC